MNGFLPSPLRPRPPLVIALLVLLVWLGFASAQSPFSLDVTPGSGPVGTVFRAEYVINVTAGGGFTLDWGDGASTPVQGGSGARTHTYAQPGTYSVRVLSSGATRATRTVTVTPAPMPAPAPSTTCTLEASPASPTPGQNVTFTARFSGPIEGVRLEFGDGAQAPLNVSSVTRVATASHAYGAPGTFVARVLDAAGRPLCTLAVAVKAPPATLALAPNPANVGQDVTATLGSLVAGTAYTLEWGDGAAQPIGGSGAASAKHAYAQPGVYVARLVSEGMGPVTATVTVRAPAATLALAPNPALVGQDVTATLGSLTAGALYTLEWGDGASQSVTGSGAASAKHAYAQPGVYVVRLLSEGTAPVTATLTVRAPAATLALNPNPANVGQDVTATLGSLTAGINSTLEWGDGAVQSVTGSGTLNLKHAYAAPGVYVARLVSEGAAPVTATVTVRLPALGLAVTPSPAKVGENVTAALTGLAPGVPYTLEWGDGASQTVTGSGAAAARHPFGTPGVYVVRLTAEGAAPVTATVRVTSGLAVEGLRLKFTAPQERSTLIVTPGTRVDAALELEFSGAGVVRGGLLLDGRPFGLVELNATSGKRRAVLPIPNLPTTELGAHTLEFRPEATGGEAPAPATPGVVTYLVREAPTVLEIAGFEFDLTKTSSLDFEDFAGEARHTLVLAGAEAFRDVKVAFRDLRVVEAGERRVRVVEGEFTMFLTARGRAPLSAELLGVHLRPKLVRFTPQGATFRGDVALRHTCEPSGDLGLDADAVSALEGDAAALHLALGGIVAPSLHARAADLTFTDALPGGVTVGARPSGSLPPSFGERLAEHIEQRCRPDPAFTVTVEGPLAPVSGDLVATGTPAFDALPVPNSPFSIGGATKLTLDLSAAASTGREADVLPAHDLLPAVPRPPVGAAWTGVVLENARPQVGTGAAAPTTATLRRGWTFRGGVAGGTFEDRGWAFQIVKFDLAVAEGRVAPLEGDLRAELPLFARTVPVKAAAPSGRVVYTLAGPINTRFGLSVLSASGGVWTQPTPGRPLELRLGGAAWNLDGLQRSRVRRALPSGPLAADPDRVPGVRSGNVRVGGFRRTLDLGARVAANADRLAADAMSSGPGAMRVTGGPGGPLEGLPGLGDPEIDPTPDAEGGVVALGTLVLAANGDVRIVNALINTTTSDGLTATPITAPDIAFLDQALHATHAVIGRAGGAYVLGLEGRLALSSQVRAIGVQVRYTVENGREREALVRTEGFEQVVNDDAKFKVEASERRLPLGPASALASQPVNPRVAALGLAVSSASPSATLQEVEGGYELVLSGGLTTGRGSSAMTVQAEALFGLTDDPYFYVKAGVESRAPIVSVLGVFNVYGFTGGVAHNMKWPEGAKVSDYAKPPVKSGDGRVQIIGGLTAAFEDGNSLHFTSVFKIDTQRGFELAADGWVLTGMDAGVFGARAPQARLLASVTAEGFDLAGCVGPQTVGDLDCSDLRRLSIMDVLEVQAWLRVRIADQKFIKIGTNANPVEAELDILGLKVGAHGYFIVGDAMEDGDLPKNRKETGVFMGVGFEAKYGAAGAFDTAIPFFDCYPWARALFWAGAEVDMGFSVDPLGFRAGAAFHAGLEVKAGCAGRDRPFRNKQEIMEWDGRSIGLSLEARVSGELSGFSPFAFAGRAEIEVDIPIIPTFTVGVDVSF